MDSTDVENQSTSSHILLLVIIATILVNLLALSKIVMYSGRSLASVGRPKHLLLVLLSFGDICIALFPLQVELHGQPETIPCWIRISAHTFLFHLMPFVHALGIIVLAVESMTFWRQYPRNVLVAQDLRRPHIPVLSFLPWVLGLVVILPLLLAGFDFDACSANYSITRISSFYWVSIIIPGSVTLIIASRYMMTPTTGTSHSTAAEVAVSLNMLRSIDNDGDEKNILLLDEDKFTAEPLDQFDHHSLNLSLSDAQTREKKGILAASVLFCVCALPMAVLSLVYLASVAEHHQMEWAGEVQMASALEVLYRLHVLRSLISPLVWANDYI